MISILATKAAHFFAGKKIYDHQEVATYIYGFQLLISMVINGLIGLIISILMGSVLHVLFFMAAFVPLRMTAGGYHAKHHFSCIFGSNAIFFGFSLLCTYLDVKFVFAYVLCSITFSALMVCIFSPVEAINKPLTAKSRKRNRKHSLIICCANAALAVLFYCLPYMPAKLASYYISGALAASVLLPVADFANKRAKRQTRQTDEKL
jgi:accessory gene regulator B